MIFKVLFALLFSYVSYAQTEEQEQQEQQAEEEVKFMTPQLSIVKKSIVKDKEPIEYAEILEENALWVQVVWRRIDCRERMNYHLYYPTEDLSTRRSLAQTLIDGIRAKKIQAYDDEEMQIPLSSAQVLKKLGAEDKEIIQEKIDGSGDTVIHQKGYVKWNEVREFMLKEEWIIDKKHGRLDVRILGMCPIRVYKKDMSGGSEESSVESELRNALFWVYFPEARRVLANTICYNGKNQIANLSFDDVFHKRYFSSYIEKMSNEINDREIREYTRNGLEALLESERIKRFLLETESDLWSY
ncbi:MAG: gliding motility protein GldN [Prevotellaceae bacterium]|jgi:gliding motility associated protien GldN|nr:gliding motility protein GldN [Prevotellaceae bacterium]